MGEAGQLSRGLNDFFTPVTHPALGAKAAPGAALREGAPRHAAPHRAPPPPLLLPLRPPHRPVNVPDPPQRWIRRPGAPPHLPPRRVPGPRVHQGGPRGPAVRRGVRYHPPQAERAAVPAGAQPRRCSHRGRQHYHPPCGGSLRRQHGLAGHPHPPPPQPRGPRPRRGHGPDPRGGRHGAGGLLRPQQLNLTRFYVYNRTPEKAQQLAAEFGGTAVTSLSDLEAPDVVIGTIPAGAQGEYPSSVFAKQPVTMDLAYRPRRTALLQQAQAAGCATIEGIDLLIEQGLVQFELWTGCPAPRAPMAQAVYWAYTD
eukprot:TRINITY_DN1827_c0_g1_i1.p1 TRINITY_DN1827_c0_g1~~TRINITY_DN1827_c0_g1_i1.p1  ORF type:complete len:312 (-),score=26.84 TRINITY_DN1827_c0_g1_i1:235-1170(-)